MRDIVISLGRPNNLAAVTKTVSTAWPKFAKFLTKEPPETEDKASVGWYCAAQFDPEYRDGKNFVARHCLTFDYDEINECDLKEIRKAYKKFEHVMYTTSSHSTDAPRIRVVFPLSRPSTMDEFCCVTRTVAAYFDIEKLARESDTPAQMMFLPSKRPGKMFYSVINHGEWIDVDKILGEYDDWTDREGWPRRLRGDSVVSVHDIEAPDTKVGIVGDFCRAFRIPDAIHRFELPYDQGSSEERYTYTKGSRPDGLRLYDDGLKAHSDHNTDPANGQTNAFDLVRLHRFADRDSEDDLGNSITQRPSYKAMCAFAMEQPEIRQAQLTNEFEDLGPSGVATVVQGSDEKGREEQKESAPNRFKVIPAPEFASDISLDWLIKGVIPKAELMVIYGESGSGKTFLALDLCAAVVRGVSWRDRTVRQGRGVYVCAEGASGFRQRLRAYSQANSIELSEFGVVGEAPNLLDEKDAAAITHAICQYGNTDLVVIDTLSAVIPGGDENTGKDLGKLVEHCKFIHRKTGALVVLIHHSGKDTSKGARGWSGLRAAADAELEITRNGDYRTASVTKMKDGSDGKSWPFKLQTVVLGVDDDGDEITSCVIEHVDAAPVVISSEPGGLFAKNALRVARRLGKTGELMDMEELVEAAISKLPRGDSKRDTRRQNTQRAVQKLVVDGLLFLHDDNKISLTTAELSEEWMDE